MVPMSAVKAMRAGAGPTGGSENVRVTVVSSGVPTTV
jgi:hypothetical protein